MSVGGVVLVDTGPLVALFDPSDAQHARCQAELARLRRRTLVTSLAVVTEAAYLLDFSVRAQSALLRFIGAGAVELESLDGGELLRVGALMERYADRPMDFADATLVVLAEKLQTPWVFTLDGDFEIYRLGRRHFRCLPAHR